jgi:hypothetical protein
MINAAVRRDQNWEGTPAAGYPPFRPNFELKTRAQKTPRIFWNGMRLMTRSRRRPMGGAALLTFVIALIIFAALYARVRRWDADDGTGGAMRGRGWRATAPRFNNCGEA